MGSSIVEIGTFGLKRGGGMDTAIHSAMWALVNSGVNATIGWVMAAAGPVLALAFAILTGLAVWNTIFEDVDEDFEQDEAMGAGSQEGFDHFMAAHRGEEIDPDDD